MDSNEAEPVSLPQLPLDALHSIWQQLKDDEPAGPVHQHALRCACRAMRDASNEWISSIRVEAGGSLAMQQPHLREMPAHRAMSSFLRFPRSAVLRKLAWDCNFGLHPHDDMQVLAMQLVQDFLPTFLFQTHKRLLALRSFTFTSDASLTFGDISALVEACPHLQHVEFNHAQVIGPVFAPLRHLRSLSSWGLRNLGTSIYCKALVVVSLPVLSTLTKLSVIQHVGGKYDEQEVDEACTIASPSILPWVASLSQLRDLELVLGAHDDYVAGEDIAHHISSLQHLTRLKVRYCPLPSSCPPLACASNLTELNLEDQAITTPLIRLFAAMPKLSSVTVAATRPDTDLSQLPCGWDVLVNEWDLTLQSLLWLPRSIGRVGVSNGLHWELKEGDSLDSACNVLKQTAQLLADKPEWLDRDVIRADVNVTPTAEPQGPQAGQEGAWAQLIQALAPLQRNIHTLEFGKQCKVDAEVAKLGAQWMPELERLETFLITPGLDSFIEALAETDWLPLLDIRSAGQSLSEGTVEALRRLAVKRSSAGHGILVRGGEWFPTAQVDMLNQAAAQHCTSDCRVEFEACDWLT